MMVQVTSQEWIQAWNPQTWTLSIIEGAFYEAIHHYKSDGRLIATIFYPKNGAPSFWLRSQVFS